MFSKHVWYTQKRNSQPQYQSNGKSSNCHLSVADSVSVDPDAGFFDELAPPSVEPCWSDDLSFSVFFALLSIEGVDVDLTDSISLDRVAFLAWKVQYLTNGKLVFTNLTNMKLWHHLLGRSHGILKLILVVRISSRFEVLFARRSLLKSDWSDWSIWWSFLI